jgi:hypothetical protein
VRQHHEANTVVAITRWSAFEAGSAMGWSIINVCSHIKGQCRPTLGFKSHRIEALTLAGIALAHRISKGQFVFVQGR